jgi:hypothetical protein
MQHTGNAGRRQGQMCQALGPIHLILCYIIRKAISLQGRAFKGKPPGPEEDRPCSRGSSQGPGESSRARREVALRAGAELTRLKAQAAHRLQCLSTLPRLPASASGSPSGLPGHAVVCGTALPSSRVPPRPSVPQQALLQDLHLLHAPDGCPLPLRAPTDLTFRSATAIPWANTDLPLPTKAALP